MYMSCIKAVRTSLAIKTVQLLQCSCITHNSNQTRTLLLSRSHTRIIFQAITLSSHNTPLSKYIQKFKFLSLIQMVFANLLHYRRYVTKLNNVKIYVHSFFHCTPSSFFHYISVYPTSLILQRRVAFAKFNPNANVSVYQEIKCGIYSME